MKEKDKDTKKESFKEKLKDKKYKAKLELIIGFGLIIILFIYTSVSGVSSNYNYNSTTIPTTPNEEETFILDEITNNYSYEINISLTRIDNKEDTDIDGNLTQYNYSYTGKTYENNTIINKIVDNTTTTYYQIDNEYYTQTNSAYTLADIDNIYDLIEQKYLSLTTIKEYISSATLDHTTNYSNGNTSYVYNLPVKEIIKTYTEDNNIKIEINVENDIPIINIDYTNLLNAIDNSLNVNECQVTFKYTDINEVEEFTIIEEDNQSLSTNNTN